MSNANNVKRMDSKMMHDNQYVSLFGVEGLKIADYRKHLHKPSTLLLSPDAGQPPAYDVKSQNLSMKESV